MSEYKLGQNITFQKNMGLCSFDDCMSSGDKICSQCKAVTYCSKDCQKLDWKFHKLTCKSKTKSTAVQSTAEIDWIEITRRLQQFPKPSKQLSDFLSWISHIFKDPRQYEKIIEYGHYILRELIELMDDDSAGMAYSRELALYCLACFANEPSVDFHLAKRAAKALFDENCKLVPRVVKILYKEEAYINQEIIIGLLKGTLKKSNKNRLVVSNPDSGVVQALIDTLKRDGSSAKLRSIAADTLLVIQESTETVQSLRRVPNILSDILALIGGTSEPGTLRCSLVGFLAGIVATIPVDIPTGVLITKAMMRVLSEEVPYSRPGTYIFRQFNKPEISVLGAIGTLCNLTAANMEKEFRIAVCDPDIGVISFLIDTVRSIPTLRTPALGLMAHVVVEEIKSYVQQPRFQFAAVLQEVSSIDANADARELAHRLLNSLNNP